MKRLTLLLIMVVGGIAAQARHTISGVVVSNDKTRDLLVKAHGDQENDKPASIIYCLANAKRIDRILGNRTKVYRASVADVALSLSYCAETFKLSL